MNSTKRIVACLGAAAMMSGAAVASAQLSYNFTQVPRSGKSKIMGSPFYYYSYFNGCSATNGIGGGLAWKWGTTESAAMKSTRPSETRPRSTPPS
jgi:hypothetical protein